MRNRKIAGVAVGLATAMLVVGCSAGGGGDEPVSAEQQNVTLWMYPVMADEAAHKAHWDGVIADFESENPNIAVEYEIFPWTNRDEALQTAIAAKVGPDLVYLIPDQLAAYQKSIEPMGPYLSEERMADLLPNVVESVTLDGNMLGSPLLTTANSLLCNAAAFEAAGVTEYPETWDDVLEIAPKFAEKDMYAISYAGSAEMTLNMSFYPLLWQAGGSIYEDGGEEVAFNSKAGVEALTFLTDLAEQNALEPDGLLTAVPLEQTALAQGKVGCTWNRAAADILPFWAPEDVVVLAPLTNEETVSYGTVGSLAMLKGAESKEAAAKFAEFAAGPDVVVPYLKASGFFSALASTGELYADDPILAAVEANIPTTTVGELYPSSRELMGVLSPEIQAALLGDKSPQEALDAAAAAAQPLIAK
jgi:multiple sugar transport system substrate-binding protein